MIRLGAMPAELLVGGFILLAGLATDLFWVRPQQADLERLLARRKAAEQSVGNALRDEQEWASIQDYLNQRGLGGGTWRDRYLAADPLRIVDGTRERAGLNRLDLRLVSEEPAAPFSRTRYFVSMNGSFERQVRFLKELEMSQPLATVESFVMNPRPEATGVDFKINVSLLTLPEPGR